MSYISRKVVQSAMVVGLISAPVMASAADFSRAPIVGKAVPYAPPLAPQYRWDGFHVGINSGGAFGSSFWTIAGDSFNTAAWMVGVTAGYDMQFGGLVAGIEGDFDYVKSYGGTSVGACAAGCSTDLNYLATVRGRIGFAMDRFMPYATAGLAAGRVEVSRTGVGNLAAWRYGYAIGAGIEVAALYNWSVKGEYLFVDLGTRGCSPVCGGGTVSYYTNIMRLGVNYRF